MAETAKREPTREQVKAWIQAFYPPTIDGLEVELSWLQRGRPSWQFHARTLEYFAPLRERVYAAAQPLFDQFMRYHPHIATLAETHDNALRVLEAKCATAQSTLEDDPEFGRAVASADEHFRESKPNANHDWYGTFPVEQRAALAAEYVVNGIPPDAVPGNYTTREFWACEGGELLKHRTRFESLFDELKQALAHACRSTKTLRDVLIESRDHLADHHGLPAASVDSD